MLKTYFLILVGFVLISFTGLSQDEGVISKKGEVSKAKSVFIGMGPSYRFGNNNSDYKGGFVLEGGFLKRINRILAVGPSFSYTKFDYDRSISDSYSDRQAEGNNIFYETGGYEIRVVNMKGGDLKFISAGFNVKVNFIPISESKKFTFYANVKPFILLSKKAEITATYKIYYSNTIPAGDPSTWYVSTDTTPLTSPYWSEDNKLSGGLNVGVGAGYILPSGLEFFLNGSTGLTLPVSHIRTSEFPNTLDNSGTVDQQVNPKYPLVKKGFTTFIISLGVAFNF